MWVSWFLLGFMQVFLGRWFPFLTTKSGKIHAVIGIIIFLANIIAALFIVGETGGMNFAVDHEKYGWVVIFILVFFNVSGIMALMAKNVF